MKKLAMRIDELIERKARIDGRPIRIKDVHEGAGITRKTLNSYRRGNSDPTLRNITALCNYFDCDTTDLLVWVDVDPAESA